MGLPLGSRAPDFELKSQSGALVRLSEITAESVVVLFFYPKDGTPGCTAESCAFRDAYSVFRDAGADVVGVSRDSVASHESFAAGQRLNFRILSDGDGAVHAKYGVKDTIPFLLPGRETFVIDRDRVIRHHFSSQIRATKHVAEALRVVSELAGREEPRTEPALEAE